MDITEIMVSLGWTETDVKRIARLTTMNGNQAPWHVEETDKLDEGDLIIISRFAPDPGVCGVVARRADHTNVYFFRPLYDPSIERTTRRDGCMKIDTDGSSISLLDYVMSKEDAIKTAVERRDQLSAEISLAIALEKML
jgi:hypothetical protein